MDNRKIIVTSYLTVSAILWYLSRSVLQWLYLTYYQVRRVPGITTVREVLPLVIGGLVFLILYRHATVNAYAEEVVSELKKVTWPGRPDVVRSTTVVLVCIVIASALLATFDLIFGKLVGWGLTLNF